jgi:excisionase family DNA binding protein
MAILNQSAAPPATGPNRDERRHPRRWATLQATADYLGVTKRTVRQMVDDGRLNAYRNGSRLVRLDLDEVDAAMTPVHGGAA